MRSARFLDPGSRHSVFCSFCNQLPGLTAACECAQLLGFSKQAVMLCHPQIAVSNVGCGANRREAAILLREVAITLCSIQCIQHGAPPLLRTRREVIASLACHRPRKA